jgi:hypothetical protein
MAALEGCTSLSSLNGCEEYRQVLAGGIRKLDVDGKELGVALGPYLERSASTLVALEMRCCPSCSLCDMRSSPYVLQSQRCTSLHDASSNYRMGGVISLFRSSSDATLLCSPQK